jgi:hypothetical protein
MPREIGIALGSVTTYEAWAVYLAVLAWPEDRGEGERVARSHAALSAWFLHSRAQEDGAWMWSPQLVKPGYLLLDAQSVKARGDEVFGRIKKALRAARMARPFLAPLIEGRGADRADGTGRLALNAVVERVLELEGDAHADAHNVEQRVFRAFFPVLHLAVALEQVLDRVQARLGRTPSFEDLMGDAAAFVEAVRLSDAAADLLRKVGQFKIPTDDQVVLRPDPA